MSTRPLNVCPLNVCPLNVPSSTRRIGQFLSVAGARFGGNQLVGGLSQRQQEKGEGETPYTSTTPPRVTASASCMELTNGGGHGEKRRYRILKTEQRSQRSQRSCRLPDRRDVDDDPWSNAGRARCAREGGRAIPDSQVTCVKNSVTCESGIALPPSSRPHAAGCQRSTRNRLSASLTSPFTPLTSLLRF